MHVLPRLQHAALHRPISNDLGNMEHDLDGRVRPLADTTLNMVFSGTIGLWWSDWCAARQHYVGRGVSSRQLSGPISRIIHTLDHIRFDCHDPCTCYRIFA
jgi:hypothetical protein